MEKNSIENYLEKYVKGLFKGSLLNFLGEIIKRLGGYIYQVAIVRFLGTFVYGIYTLSYTLINIVLRFSQLGLDRGGIRYIAILKEEKRLNIIKRFSLFLFFLSFFSGIFWGAVTFFLSSPLSFFYKKPALKEGLKYFSFSIPFYTSLLVMAYSSRGFNKMEYYVISENFTRPFLQFVFFFLMLYILGKNLKTAILPWFFSSLFSLILILYFFEKENKENESVSRSNYFDYKEVITFSIPVTFISILYFLFAWTDLIILGFFRPEKEIGIYNAVARTAEMTNLFLLSINEVFSPLVSQLSYKKDIESLGRVFRLIVRWTLHFSLPLLVFLIFSGKDFLIFVFGKEFILGFFPMIVLLAGLTFQNAGGPVGMTLTMSGYQKEWAFMTLLSFILNIFLGIMFIPKFGILGASFSTCFSLVFLRSLGIFGVKRFLKFKTHDLKTFKPLIQGLITFIFTGILNLFTFKLNFLIKIFLNFILSYVFYLLTFFVLKPESEEVYIFNKLKSLFKKG